VKRSRRNFLSAAGATCAAAAIAAQPASAGDVRSISADAIVDPFTVLPGDVALKIVAPWPKRRKPFVASLNPDRMLFAASAIKSYVLCEALRQADAPDVVDRLEDHKLALDSTVWSYGSPTFIQGRIEGIVSERTAMEAMITRSDNTATDIMFKTVGADNVRAFIASAGLVNTLVPDSTRAFTGYLFGADDYKNLTWERLQEVVKQQQVHPFLNSVQTLASSADDFVSYYSRALQGAFFTHAATLNEFRRIHTLCDFIYLIPVPLGVSAYAKSGNADTPGFHVRSVAGGLYFDDQWVYFAFMLNWYSESAEDPQTVGRFFSAINAALALLKHGLG